SCSTSLRHPSSTPVLSRLSLILTYLSLTPLFFFNDPAPPDIYTLSLHDALPISLTVVSQVGEATTAQAATAVPPPTAAPAIPLRSEEHTSELQSLTNLVCRLLLEKKKKKIK